MVFNGVRSKIKGGKCSAKEELLKLNCSRRRKWSAKRQVIQVDVSGELTQQQLSSLTMGDAINREFDQRGAKVLDRDIIEAVGSCAIVEKKVFSSVTVSRSLIEQWVKSEGGVFRVDHLRNSHNHGLGPIMV